MSDGSFWFKWYPRDYNSDKTIAHFDVIQDNAYRKIIEAQMESPDGLLPDDPAVLFTWIRLNGISLEYFQANVWPVIKVKFKQPDKRWVPLEGKNVNREKQGRWVPIPEEKRPPGKICNDKAWKIWTCWRLKEDAKEARQAAIAADTSDAASLRGSSITTPSSRTTTFDFEKAYQEYYPHRADRNKSKSEGMKLCEMSIDTPELFEELVSAMRNYTIVMLEEQEIHGWTDVQRRQFTLNFNNFMKKWREYLPLTKKKSATAVEPTHADTDAMIAWRRSQKKYVPELPWEQKGADLTRWIESSKAKWMEAFFSDPEVRK